MGPRPEFYRRLLAALALRRGLQPQVSQTPLEFAAVAAEVLQRDAGTAAWSALPAQAAHALYRIRFAGRNLTPAEQAALEQSVAGLEQAL